MLTREELEKSPLFQGISYESYCAMLDCFQAVQKSFRSDELIYDFTMPTNNAVGSEGALDSSGSPMRALRQ